METNPRSLATFSTKEDSSFHQLFVSFMPLCMASNMVAGLCFSFDSSPLKSKYQGTLLAATAADGDDAVFPVAFGIANVETDDNWQWVLVRLKSALSTVQSITFVADREKELKDPIADIFRDVDVHHGYSICYLSEQLIRDLKEKYSHEVRRLIVEDFYFAAVAPRLVDLQRPMEEESSKSTVTVIPPPYRRHCQPPTPKPSGSKRVAKRKRQVQCQQVPGYRAQVVNLQRKLVKVLG